MVQVFVSYAREDRDYVHSLVKDLRRHDFEVWIDDRIGVGDRWWQTIVQAIRNSAAFLVVMTPDSEKSEWVESEIMLAKREAKPIFPLLHRGEEFPLLINMQHIDVSDGQLPPEEFYESLGRILLLKSKPQEEKSDSKPLPKRTEAASKRSTFILPISSDVHEKFKKARKYLLAAETFAYSYANYSKHLGVGNSRFDELMPNDIDTLEQAEQEDWDDARLAEALQVEEEDADFWRVSYQRAKEIVDAPHPAEAFRRGVQYSILDAIEEGLSTEGDIKALVTQVCYRAADLAYLLDLEEKPLSDYSEILRETPDTGIDPEVNDV